MNYRPRLFLLLISSAALSFCAPLAVRADILAYGVFKAVAYQQPDPVNVRLFPRPWFFLAGLGVNDPGNFTGATVLSPNGQTHQMEFDESESFNFTKDFVSLETFNQEFPAGSYLFTIKGRQGTKTARLNFGADAYPSTP